MPDNEQFNTATVVDRFVEVVGATYEGARKVTWSFGKYSSDSSARWYLRLQDTSYPESPMRNQEFDVPAEFVKLLFIGLAFMVKSPPKEKAAAQDDQNEG